MKRRQQSWVRMRRMAEVSSWLWGTSRQPNKLVLASSILLLILAANVHITNCSKSTRTVEKGAKEVSHNKVPLVWRPDRSFVMSKSYPPPPSSRKVASSECGNSTLRSKCKKQKKLEKGSRAMMVKDKFRKKKFSDKFYSKMVAVQKYNSNKSKKRKGDNLDAPTSLRNVETLTPQVLVDINKFVSKKRSYCRAHEFEGWACQKLRLSTWLAKQMEKETLKFNSWLEVVRRPENETGARAEELSRLGKDLREVRPESWPEKIAYRLIKAWGDPEDLFVFYKYKDYLNTRELKISLPYQVELKVSPRSSSELVESGRSKSEPTYSLALGSSRTFWDPGFNLKLKLPFFRDELKVAVSTGPSFVAGIGVGIAVLIIKSMFAPMLLGAKWMMYNVFFKESSPFELMKMFFLSHSPEPWESAPIPPPAIEHYSPPPIRHHSPPFGRPPRPPPPHYHHHPPYPPPPPPFHRGPKGLRPPPRPPHFGPSYDMDYHYSHPPFDLKHQFTQPTPMIQSPPGEHPTMSQLEHLYRAQLVQEGLGLKSPSNDLGDGIEHLDGPPLDPQDSQSYIPSTGLQAEVEHFDPFYSPLLSKIDTIFTHLGHNDEWCRERVVCSIYKFPVKYAPYSNLISAQLSKHQTELKRPVTSSPKILRYFRYMKAAKDGQSGGDCAELYPKCGTDTDIVSSLPMITTFHQLSELMTAESSSPGVALAAAG